MVMLTIQNKSRKTSKFYPFWDIQKPWTVWDYFQHFENRSWIGWWNVKNFNLLLHQCCIELPRSSYHVGQLTIFFITSTQRQESLIPRVGPTQWGKKIPECSNFFGHVGNFKLLYFVHFRKVEFFLMLPKNLGTLEKSLWFKKKSLRWIIEV